VNGRRVRDPMQAFQILEDLRDARNPTVGISRRGARRTVNCEIRWPAGPAGKPAPHRKRRKP